MLLAIDIGNSAIKFGIFDADSLVDKFLIQTKLDYTVEELLFDRLRYINEQFFQIDSVIVSSVVPELDEIMRQACKNLLKVTPVFIDGEFNFGLQIKYEQSAAGSDRLVSAASAAHKYGKPVIVCSFGTATTIDAVNSEGEYLGGAIAPGMNTLAEALHLKTSKLPHVAIDKPLSVIGSTTVDSIRSGVFFGYIGLVEGLITRINSELISHDVGSQGGDASSYTAAVTRSQKIKVVATGGFARTVADSCDQIDIVDENLLLDGLRMLFDKQRS